MVAEPVTRRRELSSRTTARALFAVLAIIAAAIGGWAEFAPHSFYRIFPGFGRHWLAPLGPYNEHLLRDFGALNLGLAAAAIAAVILLGGAAWAAAAAWIAYSLPHLVFHAVHTEPFGVADNVASMLALSLALVAPAIALWLTIKGEAALAA